jgi:hypothetical protein
MHRTFREGAQTEISDRSKQGCELFPKTAPAPLSKGISLSQGELKEQPCVKTLWLCDDGVIATSITSGAVLDTPKPCCQCCNKMHGLEHKDGVPLNSPLHCYVPIERCVPHWMVPGVGCIVGVRRKMPQKGAIMWAWKEKRLDD